MSFQVVSNISSESSYCMINIDKEGSMLKKAKELYPNKTDEEALILYKKIYDKRVIEIPSDIPYACLPASIPLAGQWSLFHNSLKYEDEKSNGFWGKYGYHLDYTLTSDVKTLEVQDEIETMEAKKKIILFAGKALFATSCIALGVFGATYGILKF